MIDHHHGWNKSFKPSIIGFVISLFLSIGLWRIVVKQEYSHWLTITILAVAVLQAVFQLVFFSAPRNRIQAALECDHICLCATCHVHLGRWFNLDYEQS